MRRLQPTFTLAEFAIGAATTLLVCVLALQNGTYDLVDRQSAGALIWWALGLAAMVGLAPRLRPRLPGFVALSAMAAMTAWSVVTLRWSQSDERTLAEVARTLVHLGFFAGAALVIPPARWKAIIVGAIVGAVAICGIALSHRLAPDLIGASDPATGLAGIQRLSYPLAYWNAVGAWAALTASLLLAVSAHAPSRAIRGAALALFPMAALVTYLTFSRASLAGLAIGAIVVLLTSRHRWTAAVNAVVAAALSALAIITIRGQEALNAGTGTEGRGAVLLALVGSFLAAAAFTALLAAVKSDEWRLPSRVGRPLIAAAAISVVAISAIGAATYGPKALDQFRDTTNVTSSDPTTRLGSLQGTRSVIWESAWDQAKVEPWKGTGAGTFEFTWNVRGTNSEFVRDTHSIWLEALTEQGIPGLLLLLAFSAGVLGSLALAMRRADDAWSRGLLAGVSGATAVYGLSASVDWMWETTAITVLALLMLGAVTASTGKPAKGGIPARAAIITITLMAIAFQLPGLVGTSDVRRSERAVRSGDLNAARRHADEAIDVEPWATSPLIQRALVDERSGQFAAAARSLALARARDPKDWRIPLLQARVLARDGQAEAALAAYRAAKALRPEGDFFTRAQPPVSEATSPARIP